ncbi:hypothetical protein SBA6_350017 [Candidatus Sulfopaludibacter sp. SbA6]|nr:hypothetical protein SBA6_350017 [Candidatus Sulfopaludibacter sp. SbA6]
MTSREERCHSIHILFNLRRYTFRIEIRRLDIAVSCGLPGIIQFMKQVGDVR